MYNANNIFTNPNSTIFSLIKKSLFFFSLFSSTIPNFTILALLQEIKQATSKPVAVGFGISKPEHVQQIAEWGADGVTVGSVLVRLLGESTSAEEGLKQLETFTKSLKAAPPWHEGNKTVLEIHNIPHTVGNSLLGYT